MHIFVRPSSPCLTPKNYALAVVDVISGVIIVVLAITGKSPGMFYAATTLALITHAF